MNILNLSVVLTALISVSARRVTFTYYWNVDEADYSSGPKNVVLKSCNGKVLAKVTNSFYKNLRIECSGLLVDGRIINGNDNNCKCFAVVDAAKGNRDNSLVLFVSIACNDERHGRKCYVKQLDGVSLPGGEKHNGCVRVDDVGGGLGNNHIDFFVYKKKYYGFFDKKMKSTVDFTCPSSCTLKNYKY